MLKDCIEVTAIEKTTIRKPGESKKVTVQDEKVITKYDCAQIDESTNYIKNKGFDDKYYKDLIVEYLKKYEKAKKKDIRELLWDKLPDALSNAQKEHKVSNLLAGLKKTNVIDTDSVNQQRSHWILKK